MVSLARMLTVVAIAGMLAVWSGGVAAQGRTLALKKKDGSGGAAAVKPEKKKRKSKKKKEAAPAESKVLPYGGGLKIGILPYYSLSALRTDNPGRTSYDMDFAWGWGAAGEFRLFSNLNLTGELMYWYAQVGGVENHKKEDWQYKESDGLLNMGIGLRYNVMGGEFSSDRVYIKGQVGYSHYFADDANTDTTNRKGIYYGGGGGIEHSFGPAFSVFAESGLYWNSFSNPGTDESESSMFLWQVCGGVMLRWDKKD